MEDKRVATSFYAELERIYARPKPFEIYTAVDLWTNEHTSKHMLAFHLNSDVDVSSRKALFIEKSVEWLANKFCVGPGSRVIDFGCGPGLYASRLAKLGASVTGIDFSARSIDYAREYANRNKLRINYMKANYLECNPEGEFDLILMIMCDFCALSPIQRTLMLQKFESILSPRGHVVLDVYSHRAFERRSESSAFEKNLMNGFWSPNVYHGFLNVLKYEAEKVVLDKYTIIAPKKPGGSITGYNISLFKPLRRNSIQPVWR